jgi:hypothetical protein
MAQHQPHRFRAVLLIEDETGKRQAYEIGDAPGAPFTFSRDGAGRIEVSGLFLGGAVWDAPMPDLAPREISPE